MGDLSFIIYHLLACDAENGFLRKHQSGGEVGRAAPNPASMWKLHYIPYWLFHIELSLTSTAIGKLNATGLSHPGPFHFCIWNAQDGTLVKKPQAFQWPSGFYPKASW